MTQLERVAAMEAALDQVSAAARHMEQARAEFEQARPAFEALSAYYGGADWKKDFADDEAGRLPPDLKRGVLSEDAAWNALNAYREIQESLSKI